MKLLTAVVYAVLAGLYQSSSVGAQRTGTCHLLNKKQMPSSCCNQPSSFCCLDNGQCYCDQNSAKPAACSFFHVNASVDTHCCGNLKKIDFQQCFWNVCYVTRSVYRYQPTYLEMQGLCSRTNAVPRSSWNKQVLQPHPAGQCNCKAEARTCFSPATDVPNVKTTLPTTTTTNVPDGSTTSTSTTANVPDCNTPTPATTTNVPDAKTTTTAETTAETTTAETTTAETTTAAATTTAETTTAAATTTAESTTAAATTTAETTTAAATTTTTTMTTTTTTTTTETTTTPTTTTPTTTSTTLKPKPELLCPTPPPASSARMLEGVQVDNKCDWNGVLSITSGGTLQCNGVLGFNPTKNATQIYITNFCEDIAKLLNTEIVLPFNEGRFPNDVSKATALGDVISVMDPPQGLLDKALCKTSACVYNPATMKDLIDFNSCFINSIGYDQAEVGGQLTSSGSIRTVPVTKQEGKCSSTAKAPNTICFFADNTEARGCWGDSGAPVFCRLSTTNETVLYGLLDAVGNPVFGAATADNCGTKKEFHVVPLP